MVRLRSDRWYSADGQGRSRTVVRTKFSGNRRVISLCILLALVVVLMQKAADPKHVRNAFQALGVPLEDRALQPGNGVAELNSSTKARPLGEPSQTAETSEPSDNLEQSQWSRTCRDLVPRLLSDATSAEIGELSRRWFAVGLSTDAIQEPKADNESVSLKRLREASTQQLDELLARFSANKPGATTNEQPASGNWARQLERFAAQWQLLWKSLDDVAVAVDSPHARESLQHEIKTELDEFLDRRLLATFRDATPWSKSESTAFWRLLQRGQGRGSESTSGKSPAEPPLINTLQLESESAVYRGQTIRYRGTVRRADLIERSDVHFGIDQYWSLWLRGDDDANQPITVYTTQNIAKQLHQALQHEQMPRIEVLGIVGKRLAYATEGGVEVAPTIFAASIIQFAEELAPIGARTNGEVVRDFSWSLLIGASVAACLLIPILATWRNRTIRASRLSATKLLIGWGLICWSTSLHAQPSSNFLQAENQSAGPPPWANSNNQITPDDILIDRLSATLTQEAGETLRAFFRDQQTSFPDVALKILHALRQVGGEDALKSNFAATFPDARLDVRRESIHGWVRLATPVQIDEQQQLWFQQDTSQALFRLEIETFAHPSSDQLPALTTIYCTEVPAQWLTAIRLRQPVTVDGLALISPQADETSQAEVTRRWCMFAKRPIWKLHTSHLVEDVLPPWTDRQQQLAKLGWDLVHVETTESHNRQPLRAREAEAFYSLLAGIGQAPGLEGKEHSLIEILAKKTPLVGAHVRWTVRLVSGAVVEVPNAQHQKWLGGDRYYQFDGMVDIGNQAVHYQLPGNGEPSVKFAGEFPVTLVMRETSPFVPSEKVASGELNWKVGEYVQVSGLFYRLWSYESELMSGQSTPVRQAAPLVMAHELAASAPPVRQVVTSVGWFGYALTLATLALLAGILWSVFQKPKRRLRYR